MPEEDAEALSLIERAETLFDPRWSASSARPATTWRPRRCARAPDESSAPGSSWSAPSTARAGRAAPGRRQWRRRAAELLLAEGERRAAADALRRAAEGYAAAGQLLNERRARETLERLARAEIGS